MNWDFAKYAKDFGSASGCIALASWSIFFVGYAERFRPPLDGYFTYIMFSIFVVSALSATGIVIFSGVKKSLYIRQVAPIEPNKAPDVLPAAIKLKRRRQNSPTK